MNKLQLYPIVVYREEMTRTRRQQEELRKQLDEETRHLEKEKSALEGEVECQFRRVDERELTSLIPLYR